MHDKNLSFTSNQENGNSNMGEYFSPSKLEKKLKIYRRKDISIHYR